MCGIYCGSLRISVTKFAPGEKAALIACIYDCQIHANKLGARKRRIKCHKFFSYGTFWREVKSVTYLNTIRVGILWFGFSFFVLLINMVHHNYILFNHVSA